MEKEEFQEPEEAKQSEPDFFSKLFAPLKLLITIHLKIAAKELKEDSSRLISGIICYLVGAVFFFTFLTLLNAFAISAFYTFLFSKIEALSNAMAWFCSISAWTGSALLMAIILFSAGSANFKKKFFGKTKELIEETWKEIQ